AGGRGWCRGWRRGGPRQRGRRKGHHATKTGNHQDLSHPTPPYTLQPLLGRMAERLKQLYSPASLLPTVRLWRGTVDRAGQAAAGAESGPSTRQAVLG